jgi:hypothetical protein
MVSNFTLYAMIKVNYSHFALHSVMLTTEIINPVVVGWANYYKNCVASYTFRYADHFIFLKLWQWVVRRHSNKSKEWIMKKYFSKIDNDKWCFTPDNKDK